MVCQVIIYLICDCDGVLFDSESIVLCVLYCELLLLLLVWSGVDDEEQEVQCSQVLYIVIVYWLGMYIDILLGEVDLEFELGLDVVVVECIYQVVVVVCGEEVQLVLGVVEVLQVICLLCVVVSNSDVLCIEVGLCCCGLYL